MAKLSSEMVETLNSGLNKLTGFQRRAYAAEICTIFFESSPRRMERYLKVSREMVELGMHELRTGIKCLDNFHLRGVKKKKNASPI